MKRGGAVAVCIAIIAVVCGFMMQSPEVHVATYPGASGDSWCDTDFTKRIDVNLDNSAGSTLTDYQVYVDLTSNPINETSLRVYNTTDCTLRSHWCENETGGNSYGIWINYSSVAASMWTNNTAIYYDNATSSSTSNGTNTFMFFDGFESTTTCGHGLIFLSEIHGASAPYYLDWAESVSVVGDYAYIPSWLGDSFGIYNISSKSNPTLESVIRGSGSPNYLNGAHHAQIVGNYAYVTAREDNALTIFNVGDKSNPSHVGVIHGMGSPNYLGGPTGIIVEGNYAYIVANKEDSLTIVNISNPTNPLFVSKLQGSGSPNYLNGAALLVKDGNNIYVTSSIDNSMVIINVSDINNPSLVGEIHGAGNPNYLWGAWGIAKKGSYIYVAAKEDGRLTVIDVSDSSNPTHVISVSDHSSHIDDIVINGSYLYAACIGENGLSVYNISTPPNPTYVGGNYGSGSPKYLGAAHGVFVKDSYLYEVARDDDAFSIFEIGNVYQEDYNLLDKWTVCPSCNTPVTSTDQAVHGSKSLRIDAPMDRIYHMRSGAQIIEYGFYDTTTASASQHVFHFTGSGCSWAANAIIGYNGHGALSDTEYIYYKGGTTTNFGTRTIGWHDVKVVYDGTNINMWWDGTHRYVNGAHALTTLHIYSGGAAETSYYDDIRVRKYTSSEPTSALGSEEEKSATTPAISNIQNGSISTTSQYVNATINQSANNVVIYDTGATNPTSTACEGQWSATHACANASDGNWSSYAESAGALLAYAYFNHTVPAGTSQPESLWHVKDNAGHANMTIPAACWGATLYLRAMGSDIGNSMTWQCDNGPGWTTLRSSVANHAYEEEMSFKYISTWDNATAAPNMTLTSLTPSTGYSFYVRACNATNETLCSDSSGYTFTTAAVVESTPAISNVQNGSITATAQWVSATINQTAHNRVMYWYNTQENANSTVCGGTWSVPHPCADAYDSNWNTYGEDSGSHDVTLYVNYTVPSNAIREITKWQVKDYVISPQTTNLTVPEFCWDNPLQFKINITCNGVCLLLWYCYNGTDWHELRSVGSSRVYEEQMKWAYWSDWHNSTALPNITLSGLSSNTQYYYRMRSYNATNETLSSNTSTYDFTTAAANNPITITSGKRALLCNWSTDTTFANIAANLTNHTDFFYYNSTSQQWTFYNINRTINANTIIPEHAAIFVHFNATTTVDCEVLAAETITIPANVYYYTALRESTAKTLTQIDTSITSDGCTITDMYAWNSTATAYTNADSYSILPNEGFAVYATTGCSWDGGV